MRAIRRVNGGTMRNLMEERMITLKELSAASGVSYPRCSQIARNGSMEGVSERVLYGLAKALNVRPSALCK